jgi:hypothetical protein
LGSAEPRGWKYAKKGERNQQETIPSHHVTPQGVFGAQRPIQSRLQAAILWVLIKA